METAEWQQELGVPGLLGSKPRDRPSVSLNNQPIPIRHLNTHTALRPSFVANGSRALWLFPQRGFPPGHLRCSRLRDNTRKERKSHSVFTATLKGGISVLQTRKQAHRSERICPSRTTSRRTSQALNWGPHAPTTCPWQLRHCLLKCGLQTATGLQAATGSQQVNFRHFRHFKTTTAP